MKASFVLLSIISMAFLLPSVFVTPTSMNTSEDSLVRWALKLDIAQAGRLIELPYGATRHDYSTDINNVLLWLDLDQCTLGNQVVTFVSKGATITVTGKLQTWESGATIDQDFFIYSWTPTWPPLNSTYYHALYSGIPGPYPGQTVSFNINLTVPKSSGVYYLYYCSGTGISLSDAVSKYTKTLWVPCAVITVGGLQEQNSSPSAHSYTVFTDGNFTYMQNDVTRKIEWQSSNASAVINACIGNSTEGGYIKLKAGTYYLSAPIILGGDKSGIRMTLEGEGEPTLLYLEDDVNDSVIKTTGGVSRKFVNKGLRLSDLRIFGNKANNVNSHGVEWVAFQSTIEGVLIENCSEAGIYISGVKEKNLRSNDDYVAFNRLRCNRVGLYLDSSSSDQHVISNKIFENEEIGIWSRAPAPNIVCNGVYNNGEHNIKFEYGFLWGHIESNWIGISEKSSIYIEAGVDFPSAYFNIIGNSFHVNSRKNRNAHPIIDLKGNNTPVGWVKIVGNDFRDKDGSSNYAIRFRGKVNNCVVSSNSFQGIFGIAPIGILGNEVFNLTIEGNDGFVTENGGKATVSNGEYVVHGLDHSLNISEDNSTVTITTHTTIYDNVPVIAGCSSINATHIQISAYWSNGTFITDDAINIFWSVKYKCN